MKLSHKIIYLTLLILAVVSAMLATYVQYEALTFMPIIGFGYESKLDFYLSRLQEGMFIEPFLLTLMVVGLIIKKYAGWVLTLLFPGLIVYYAIANLLDLVVFWGIVDISKFIFCYALLITLNIPKVRQIFKVDSIKMALTGNLIAISISIGFIVALGSNTKEAIRPSQIMGNWYFIDSSLAISFPYHEMHIDSSVIHIHLSGVSNPPISEYLIKADTLFYIRDQKTWPIWVFKKVTSDTLIVDLLERTGEPNKTLNFGRLAKGEKLNSEYADSEWNANPDSLSEVIMKDYFRRYDMYRAKKGLPPLEETLIW